MPPLYDKLIDPLIITVFSQDFKWPSQLLYDIGFTGPHRQFMNFLANVKTRAEATQADKKKQKPPQRHRPEARIFKNPRSVKAYMTYENKNPKGPNQVIILFSKISLSPKISLIPKK